MSFYGEKLKRAPSEFSYFKSFSFILSKLEKLTSFLGFKNVLTEKHFQRELKFTQMLV